MAGRSGPGAGTGSGRQGSAGKTSPIPHTRIEGKQQLQLVYRIGALLGEGSFGVVHEVVHLETGERLACKTVNKEKAGSSKIKLLEREVAILKRVHHEHIIRLKEVFETPQKMYLVLELCEGGELWKVLKERGTLSEEATKAIMARLAGAISYLHKNDMVHRDLKLENILLSKNPDDSKDNLFIKVTDFGLSVVKGGVGHENMMQDFCGTPMYMAPEIFENKTYGEKCDVWAMGVIMYLMLTGDPPFQSTSDDQELYGVIMSTDIQKKMDQDPKWQKISREAKDLLSYMLKIDTVNRMSATEVLHHSWFTGQGISQGPRNAIEMMKQWREDLASGQLSDVTVNGSQSNMSTNHVADATGSTASAARSSSNTSQSSDGRRSSESSVEGGTGGRKGKGPGGGGKQTGNAAVPGLVQPAKGKKPLTRNITDPNLQQTATNYLKPSGRSSATGYKGKSPTDRDPCGQRTAPGPSAAATKATKSPTDRDLGGQRTAHGPSIAATKVKHAARPAATAVATPPSGSGATTAASRTSDTSGRVKKKISR